MSHLPDHLKYFKTHEWCVLEQNVATVGVTDHAQQELGDLVYVELPEVGRKLDAGEECVVLESVKTASDVYSPVTGEVIAINREVVEHPELVNGSPYEDGWLFKVKMSEPNEVSECLTAEGYTAFIEEGD